MNDRPPKSESPVFTLIDLLRDRATGPSADRGYTFFRGDDAPDEWLRYRDLDLAARGLSVRLRENAGGRNGRPADPPRAIVLASPGPSYLKALFATLYSGMIAVTAYPPRARRRDERLDVVIGDCGATVALVDQAIFDRRQQIMKSTPSLADLRWVNIDAESPSPDAESWRAPGIMADDLAVLQYTSGSTSDPKGVCLTHRNLLSNLRMIYEVFEVERFRDRWSVTWLPPYHDMGLIGGLFQVMYAGECSHVIPPAAFIQKPLRWLKAISKYQASVSGGPNFAYDACVQRIAEEERESLDLGCWSLAFTGAEPIRESTLARFTEAFGNCGFLRTSFFPCYGLAEATLIVSGGPRGRELELHRDQSSKEASGFDAIVGCGKVASGQQVRIVNPKTTVPVPPGQSGEIWVAGENVSPGYWQQTGPTQDTFGRRLPDESFEFMRTGDLGFLREDGELFVSGRLKELIVIRGRNFQPSDLESVIDGCHPVLVPNASAAFEIETEGGPALAVVHEVEREQGDRLDEAVTHIRQRLVESAELQPHCVMLIPKRSLPKTSSGKVKRLETKRQFEAGSWHETALVTAFSDWTEEPRGSSKTSSSVSSAASAAEARDADTTKTSFIEPEVRQGKELIADWLVARLAKQLGVARTEIDIARPFSQYGLDSVSAVQIASELETYLGRGIPATLMYEAPTIDAVAARLSENDPAKTDVSTGRQANRGGMPGVRPGDIAIVGIACRMPGCDSVDEFWNLLRTGQTSITDPPASRVGCVSASATTHKAGWLSDPALFDATLFGISPREAELMDPQHRLLLESAWRAIENARLDPRRLSGMNVGAYVGISNADYERRIARQPIGLSTYSMTGNASSMAAHRLSYHLDLRGPSMAVDTACSSSLVAMHQAVRAIQAGDCDAALVAGVNLMLSHEVSETLSDAQMLSPDGLCKTFDVSANGYVRGEGCVAMLIKPLGDAIRDLDPIHAVIRGTAINQDGLTNGITAPNGESQAKLYRSALADAELSPSAVTRLETHGTGTPLGDPIEVESLDRVYGSGSGATPRCLVGAVKANVGHLEAAAGLASLLKVVLELEHQTIVPQPNLRSINPHIDLSQSRLKIQPGGESWAAPDRVAAVSSFGFGGTNAHLLVSAAPQASKDDRPNRNQSRSELVTLSASQVDVLQEIARSHSDLLQDGESLAAFARATRTQRASHRHRLAWVVKDRKDLASELSRFSRGDATSAARTGVAPTDRKPKVAWMFSGQGGQHFGMGRALYRSVDVFREFVDQCDALLLDEFGHRVAETFLADSGSGDRLMNGPDAQTSLFVLQGALVKTLESWGVRSSVVFGHSMGEYVAAVASGVMDWQDGLRLTARRANAVESLAAKGTMTVVFAPLQVVESAVNRLGRDLAIAAIDGPDHIVVSGPETAIDELEQRLDALGVATRPLRIASAFHSPLLDPILSTIRDTVSRFELRPPDRAYISTLTGTSVSQELTDPEYWVRHSRQPVQFVSGLQELSGHDVDLVMELGPHPTLCALGSMNGDLPYSFLPTLRRDEDARTALLNTAAELYVRGVGIDLDSVDGNEADGRMLLPGYPFRRKRFWINEAPVAPAAPARADVHTVVTQVADLRESEEPPISGSEIRRYSEEMKRVDGLVAEAMRQSLFTLGIGRRQGDLIVPAALVERGVVHERHQPLVKRICEILSGVGQFEPRDRGDLPSWVALTDAEESFDLGTQVSRLQHRSSPVSHELRLLLRCGNALADVLSGQVDPLSVLFPGGDISDLESLYRESPIAACSNSVVSQVARSVAAQSPFGEERKLRVLEVGAGTGGTTSSVLLSIGELIEQYTFSDVSPVLLAESQRRFSDFPEVEFRTLDIERETVAQGFADNHYDLVIAANVLHATRDLRKSLGNIRRLIQPHGFLLLLEGTRAEPFLDLVFGMTSGWWHFTDRDLRPSYPLLSTDRWCDVLSECGYRDALSVPYPAETAKVQECQSVLLAAADGNEPQRESEHASSGRTGQLPGFSPAEVVAPALQAHIDAFREAALGDQAAALEGYLRETLATITGHDKAELDLDQPVNSLGIDSLMALTLKNRLEADLGLTVPMVAFVDGKSSRQLIELALADGSTKTRDDAVALPDRDFQESVQLPDGARVIGPLSEGQQALWMIHQRAPESSAYNFAFAARSSQRLNHEALSRACQLLQRRHPVLRTCYRMLDQQPVRVLQHEPQAPIDRMDCRGWSEERIKQWIREEADRPFDLAHGPVIRFTHLIGDHDEVLSISIHHIAADLWSMDILVQELKSLYAEVAAGVETEDQGISVSESPKSFDAYVRWERELANTEEGERLGAHWQAKLSGAPQVLELPTTRPRPVSQTFDGDSFDWSLDHEVVERLRSIAQQERTTLFTVLLACYQTFLGRICGQDDLLVGTAAANRGQPQWEGIVGYLLNHLVIRGKLGRDASDRAPTFRDVVERTHQEVIEALEHQAYPFAKLVERLWPSRESSRTPLVQTMFIWDKPRSLTRSTEREDDRTLSLEPLLIEQRGAPFDLTLVVFEFPDEMRLSFRYNTDLFDRTTIESFADSLQTLVESVAGDADLAVTEVPLVSARHATQIARWNATDTEFDSSLSGYALFHRQAMADPQAIALETAEERFSYAEVSAMAGWVAEQLAERGVTEGDTVAIALPRGARAVIAILGIWRAGAAYLPLDIEHPVARLEAICQDARPFAMIVAHDGIEASEVGFFGPAVSMDDLPTDCGERVPERIKPIDPDSLAYVIFTSGSTGTPKGAVLAHRGLANLAVAQSQTFGIEPTDRCLQFASLGFDASVFEMMMAFHAGATLVVLDQAVLRSTTSEISDALRHHRVNVATLPPTMLTAMPAESLPDLHTVIAAGEALSQGLVAKWSPGRRMFNAYGPTEATVWATTHLCHPNPLAPPLGKPIANVCANVVDHRLMPMPVGVPGELCLSGPGLALEYINRPDLTAEHFVPNPFGDRFGGTLYRTGDRVRWQADGTLEFLGRIDDQVKINGHRIEPVGVAASIKRLSGISNAHVVAASKGSSRQLVAYVVPGGEGESALDVSRARKELKQQLPCYSVPSEMIPLAALPLTASGKVDESRLPKPRLSATERFNDDASPSTDTEHGLLEVWQQVLERTDIGIHDNFFDLGGASLQALQAADLSSLRGWTLSAEKMFQYQTIAELAREIDSGDSLRQPETPGSDPASGSTPHVRPDDHAARPTRPSSNSHRMIIESLGVYLPPEIVTTDAVIRGCRSPLKFPLEDMTGITSRRMAGREEFSIDLARKAAQDCLQNSRVTADEIDLLIACNISRYDGPDFEVSFEPSTAAKLKQQIGARSAVAFDVCNACAGVFTALAVAEAHLLSGRARKVMIVSGEYITHLTRTAQLEIESFLDPRLACLTLGDAGAAMMVELGDGDCGFESLDLYTAGRHHDLCVAQATDQPHGGAIMFTDPIKASAVTLDHSIPHAVKSIDACDWRSEEVQHLIPHQTSSTTIDGAIEELNRHFGETVCDHSNTVNNLRERGNTATTTHWIAVMDLIRQGRLQSGDKVVFAFSGSGQTIGTALYRFDNLPDRIRSDSQANSAAQREPVPPPVTKRTCGVVVMAASVECPDHRVDGADPEFSTYRVVESAALAARSCLKATQWIADDVELLIHSGVYRDEFLSEPAVAAIVAGELKMNDGLPTESPKRTLAFDISDGGRGTLTACSLAATMIQEGRLERAIITASEVENNWGDDCRRGVAEVGSAITLARCADPDVGFGEFFFHSYPKYADRLVTATTLQDSSAALRVSAAEDYPVVALDCVRDCIALFLAQEADGVTRRSTESFDRVLLSVPGSISVEQASAAIGVDPAKVVLAAAEEGDAFTSALAWIWKAMMEEATKPHGQRWLIAGVGAGIETVCVEYRHPK